MKKFFSFLSVVVTLLFSIETQAAYNPITAAYTIGANASTNIPLSLGTNVSFVLLSASLTAPVNNTATLMLYDNNTNSYSNSIPAYTISTSYATNWIQTWTNYYGLTNSLTNISLIDVLVTNAATNIALNADYIWSAPTNTTINFNSLNNRFQKGLLVTNQNANASATLIITYTY